MPPVFSPKASSRSGPDWYQTINTAAVAGAGAGVWMLNDKSSQRSVTINSGQFLVFISQAGAGRQSSEGRQAGNRSLYHSPQITGEINDQSWPGCSRAGEWSRTEEEEEDDQWKSLNKSTDKRVRQWWYFGLFVDCGYLRVTWEYQIIITLQHYLLQLGTISPPPPHRHQHQAVWWCTRLIFFVLVTIQGVGQPGFEFIRVHHLCQVNNS